MTRQFQETISLDDLPRPSTIESVLFLKGKMWILLSCCFLKKQIQNSIKSFAKIFFKFFSKVIFYNSYLI